MFRYLELDEAIENLPEKEVKIQIVFDDYDLRSLKDLIEKANTFFKNPKGVAATLNCKFPICRGLTEFRQSEYNYAETWFF